MKVEGVSQPNRQSDVSDIHTDTKKWLPRILSFLEKIGIGVEQGKVPSTSFLPGVELMEGVLIIDKDRLCYPGDVLHEAGHLAVLPSTDRPKASGDLRDEFPQYAGLEMGVLCWSYLAAQHLDIPIEVLFHQDGYKGESDWLVEQFSTHHYIGLPLLEWMEMVERNSSVKPPKVLKWLRD